MSGAQEESLSRVSTLVKHLDWKMYPIADDAGIYSKNVKIFRDSEENGFGVIEPFTVDIMSVPAVRHPALDKDGHMSEHDLQRLYRKVRLMYQLAQRNKIDRLVLSASGCGAWKCPSTDVAAAFKETLCRARIRWGLRTSAICKFEADTRYAFHT